MRPETLKILKILANLEMFKKISPIKCSITQNSSLIAAIELLNKQEHGFAFLVVVDEKSRLLGTLTDGDIRRSLLKGKKIEGPVKDFMFRNPVHTRYDASVDNIERLFSLITAPNPFLPLVDDDQKVIEILIKTNKSAKNVNALIMAGGFGKRLGKKTKDTPKPLITVRNKPLLEHVILNIKESGVEQIFISVHYLAEQIYEFVEKNGYSDFVTLLHEEKPMGTAGSLSLLPESQSSNFLVTNCDIITGLNYESFIDFHMIQNSDATIAVAEHRFQVPFGVIQHNKDGEFSGIKEKPVITNYVAAGLYCFSSKFIKKTNRKSYLDMPDLLSIGKSFNFKMSLFPIHEDWTDVGRPDDLEKANN